MAVLMFTTSVGVAFDLHFCKGELQDISFFKKAKNCHEKSLAKHNPPCEKHATLKGFDQKNDCCNNQAYHFQMDTDFSLPSVIDFDFHKSLYAFHFVLPELPEASSSIYKDNFYKNYKPPSLKKDHIVLLQSFLL